MHYDGKGAHTLMALNGSEVATEMGGLAKEDMVTSTEVVPLLHPPSCADITHLSYPLWSTALKDTTRAGSELSRAEVRDEHRAGFSKTFGRQRS